MSDVEIDEKTRAALGRLTAGEKDCLRRKLRHQTAKEIALDLGVSPHAVEKRLKMARAKLGLSSSVEAGRLLVAAERYQRTAPQASDLVSDEPNGKKWPTPLLALGGLSMTLFVATALALIVQVPGSAGVAPTDIGGVAPLPVSSDTPAPDSAEVMPQPGMRKASWNDVTAFLSDAFKFLDSDGSGFLDPAETSALEPRDSHRDPSLPPPPAKGQSDHAAEAKWLVKLDTDRDNRVSQDEYVGYMRPWLLWQGIPKDWKASETPAN
jgi:DNA-binding CsgD family transcriptional regulator